jgi:hypothetical protein
MSRVGRRPTRAAASEIRALIISPTRELAESLLLDLCKTGTLLCATDSGLDKKTSTKRNFFGLNFRTF